MNWREYNEKLVRRGELLLDLEFLESWGKDLGVLNRGKEGRPFRYPDGFFVFLGVLHVLFNLPFRQTEGFVRALARFVPRLRKPDHATIHRRVSGLSLDLADSLHGSNEPVVIAIDASGVKVSNRGDWIRRKWKTRRGYVKIHFAVNTKTKEVAAFEVTTEEVGDSKMFKPLVDKSTENCDVKKVLADGAYDSRDNFNHLNAKGIRPGIKIKRGYSMRARCKGRARKKAIVQLEKTRLRGMERRHRIWATLDGRDRLLQLQANLRRIRQSNEDREHGQRDGTKSLHLQHANKPLKKAHSETSN